MLKKSYRSVMMSAAVGCAAMLVPALQAIAQDFPSRVIKFVVPFPPGSGTDTSARYFGKKLSELTGQPVIVENRPGGNGFIGVQNVLSAPADGYTVFVGSNSTLAVNVALFKKLPYNPQTDFAPLSMMMRAPAVLAVPPNSPYKTVSDLIKVAKAQPGKLNYASGSAGYQLMAELFNDVAGVSTVHVPYKGASDALAGVASGTVDLTFSDITATQGLVKGGKVRALAVASERRAPALPDVPTAAESGLPGYQAYVWVGAMVSAKTPKAETEKLSSLLTQIARMPETREFYERQGAEVMSGGAEEMRSFQAAEIELWKKIVVKAKVEQQ
ncbi:Bug family tripartite tricarboxylate transporter substrate binding protein [Noviherbaspirillum sp. Root189]|uniref:Bug family tripartite tricarboxylate transporter substrate binding protein n=1 Tax=Noviherbaspirillum sp. Root189 TaxID=1736487 RepID=UPI00070A8100|nr:ABC transporter substrate-binding protein [Noviherbaspirillum sp. Root189]